MVNGLSVDTNMFTQQIVSQDGERLPYFRSTIGNGELINMYAAVKYSDGNGNGNGNGNSESKLTRLETEAAVMAASSQTCS